jgi:hypothetical protein
MANRKKLAIIGAVVALLFLFVAYKIKRRISYFASLASNAVVESSGPRTATPLTVAEAVYDGKLGAGWEDWGWGPHDLTTTGPAKVVFSGYGGIIFRHATLEANFGGLSFRYKVPADWPLFLSVSLKGAGTTSDRFPAVAVRERHVAALPDGWREVLIDLSELDPDGLSFDRIAISAHSVVASDWVLLDKVVLVKGSTQGPQASRQRNARLSIQCRAATHPINPLIYGSAGGDWDSGQTAQRVGGNPTSRYNWDLGVWNAANDWFYENGKAVDLQQMLETSLAHGARTALTVPTLGWVAKDAVSFGFPRAQFPEQRKFDPYRSEAGDGHRADGSMIKPGPPTQTSIAAPPELIGGWIRTLRDRDRAHGTHSVQMYILDNEPSLWDSTHHDVHPDPLTYDELLDRTLRYAAEIRKADPDAIIAGPAEWGWMGYMYSGKDRVAGSSRPDRAAHADMPLIPWYLNQIAAREKSTGEHILDVLDVHFYPAEDGLYGGNAKTDPDASALRLRSTRALWDPSYTDESWINEPIRLIPRLKEWIATYHPGLLISLGEWSFGADQHISGGLATAEALGRFGQQGLDAAFYWDGPKKDSATFWAFRAYRNFDGKGGRFQDVSLTTRESEGVSLFASRDAGGTKIVAILLNRDPDISATVRLELDGCARVASHRVFRFTAGSSGLLPQPPGQADEQGISETLPPYSLTVLDIDTGSKP